MAHLYPPYVTYQQSTRRQIPLVMLTPVRPADNTRRSEPTGEFVNQ